MASDAPATAQYQPRRSAATAGTARMRNTTNIGKTSMKFGWRVNERMSPIPATAPPTSDHVGVSCSRLGSMEAALTVSTTSPTCTA